MTPPILSETRSRLGLSSWQALADLLGVSLRRVQRWQAEGIPEHDARLVELACERLTKRRARQTQKQRAA